MLQRVWYGVHSNNDIQYHCTAITVVRHALETFL
jgi:hypothetical protein